MLRNLGIWVVSIFAISRPISGYLADSILAKRGQFPYLAHINYGPNSASGVLINSRHILTKADLVTDVDRVEITLGFVDMLFDEKHQQKFIVSGHDVFSPYFIPQSTDIVVIRLRRSAIINKWVRPVLLPTLRDKVKSYYGQTVYAVGFTDDGENLLAAYDIVTIRPPHQCNRIVLNEGLCVAKLMDAGANSGSPLIINTKAGNVVLGIASYDVSVQIDSEVKTAFVYARVDRQLNFICAKAELSIRA